MKNDNGTYTMLYDSSQSGSCRIYKAFSTDGITWQQQGLELDIGASGSLDEPMIFAPHVLKDTNTGTDMLYYSGYDGADRRIFLATRQQATDPVEPAEVDLAVYDNDISFSNANPDEGTTVTIEAIIHGDQSQEGQWIKSGVILDIGGAGEDLHVVAPCVLKMDDGSYVMWYTGDGDDNLVYRQRIFRATSPDGISWTRQGLALDYGNAYEQNGVLNPYVMIDDLGVYHMWYTGIGYNSGYRAYIHKAVSYDCGMSWQKMGLDLNYGSAADPDGAASSHVLYDGSQWRMWYQGIEWGSPNEGRVCHAHKAQLSDAWIKDGVVLNNDGPYDYPGVSNPRVIPNDNGYDMYYTGYDPYTGPSRILHAHSPDGLTWTKTGIILEGSLPLESNKVGLGQITFEGDTMKAWYCGHDGANWRTFYAEKPVAKAGQDATCTVSIYLDSISEANLIGRQTNVMIPADGNTIVLFDWTAVPGDHEMIAEITDSDPLDMDNTNDMAVVQITVEALPEPTEVVDIYIDDPDISISDSSPDEGEMVDIEAAIHNAALDNDALVDWKVCGEFHLTYRSHPDGCEVARPIFIGDNNNNIGVWAYGGNSVINNKRDTISLRAFGETFAVHYSSSGGSGYYDDGYYVEFWYQSSDNRFYAKLCDAADHSIIYTSGDIEAVDFSFDALSIGSNLGTEGIGWDGIPLIYEGWVDDVEFHWSEDGISGYENSLYYDFSASDGFVKVDDQIHSGVYIDSTDENVFFHADRLDTIDSGERLENSLPTALTNVAAPSYADAVCTVSFYLDSIAEENLIDRQYDVLVPGGGDTMVSTSWLADVAGDYTIIVDVHDVIPGDIDLSNNVASSQITVTEPYVPPPPLPPVAEAGPDQAIDMGVAIILDGSGSYDPDGTIVSYDWDFGDGTTGTGINALITYAAVGNYTIELTVTDNDGLSATDTCQI
ncbi:MAG: PKD domain-containing protein, partial [Thermoplasmata archaeon]|nr:PKD domain-containing protein [Thermoplasmata archaeon]